MHALHYISPSPFSSFSEKEDHEADVESRWSPSNEEMYSGRSTMKKENSCFSFSNKEEDLEEVVKSKYSCSRLPFFSEKREVVDSGDPSMKRKQLYSPFSIEEGVERVVTSEDRKQPHFPLHPYSEEEGMEDEHVKEDSGRSALYIQGRGVTGNEVMTMLPCT